MDLEASPVIHLLIAAADDGRVAVQVSAVDRDMVKEGTVMSGNHRCVFCGMLLFDPVYWREIPCEDFEETGRVVKLPFCHEACARKYVKEVEA